MLSPSILVFVWKQGLPILNVLAEMYHYNIEDPYRLGNLYYNDEYLCLWQVSAEGIIGQWDWDDDLARNGNWYEKIVAPAFREFRRKRELQTRFSQDGSQDLTTAMSNLSRKYPVRYASTTSKLTDQVGSGASDLGYRGYSAGSDVPYQETDTENEEPAPGYEVEVAYGWGTETDDDLEEEVLSTDDIIRIIEGDWE
jgi:hypothetical protein